MAQIAQVLNHFSYKEKLEVRNLWDSFFKSRMSSLYGSDIISSTQHSTLTRAFSSFIATIDMLFEQSSNNIILEEVLPELLYINFGFLLQDKYPDYSLGEYKLFLTNLMETLFKGFTILVAEKEIIGNFGTTGLSFSLADQKRNTSLGSKGLNHINSVMTLPEEVGLSLSDYNENSVFQSSKENNDSYLSSILDSSSSFSFLTLNMINGIIQIVSSAISTPQIRLIVESKSSIGSSETISSERLDSISGFSTVDYHVSYSPTNEVLLETTYFSDLAEYSEIVDLDVPVFNVDYFLLVEDYYNIATVIAENPPELEEEINVVPTDSGGGPLSLTFQYMDPFTFSNFYFGDWTGELPQVSSVVGRGLIVGSFIVA